MDTGYFYDTDNTIEVFDGRHMVIRPVDVVPEGMLAPVKCNHCGHIHDSAAVIVTNRYVDCSEWRCPGCDVIIDDRMWKKPPDITKLD